MAQGQVGGTYDIEAQLPIGLRRGTIELTERGESLSARLKAKGLGAVEGAGQLFGNAFSFQGIAKVMLVGSIDYEVQGYVDGGKIEALLKTEHGEFVITGTRR